ncbi:YciE/YciF family protein [Agaricicola taiwanensis]|uniref:YciE/YciF family protein n=1 Tax=Agaricicola taiwanensis TaxID=591372 RepID=A0A8J3DT10_9RHOB|nr:ferritin-like domain-containing protein [Agaricicola taiwanensis]GGE43226.1 YciE/YciF family protein [Agaricicola taiwanensis]
MKTMDDLFLHMLKDVYHAEKQLVRALKQMAKQAKDDQLKQAFEKHREETIGQIERLDQVFEMLDKAARGVPCEAMQGLVAEAKEVIEEAEDKEVLDAGLLAAAQAVEHYEIARYGTLVAWANQLGLKDAAKLFEQTLAEEKKTDELLSKLALQNVNKKAA